MSSKIIGHAWISGIHTIGVIVTRDDVTDELKGRIAAVEGRRERSDLEFIHDWGVQIPVSAAIEIVSQTGRWYETPPVQNASPEALSLGYQAH